MPNRQTSLSFAVALVAASSSCCVASAAPKEGHAPLIRTGGTSRASVPGSGNASPLFWGFGRNAGSSGVTSPSTDPNTVAADLTVVPLPPAAWAGLGGLGMVAGFHALRRRKNGRI